LADLHAEAAELFPSRYLHVGCDETNWGGSAFSRELLATRSRAQVCADYLNALQAGVRALGREMIIWDDMVLQHDPTVLDLLDRRIILHDWQYSDTTLQPVQARLALALRKGFRVIGGPALSWCKWGPRQGRDQLRNIEAYADAYRTANDARALGVIVAHWLPSRYLQRSVWDGLAYAAVAMDAGSAAARETAFAQFIGRHYGAAWNDRWAQVFDALYDSAPQRFDGKPGPLPVPWADADELGKAVVTEPVTPPPFALLLPVLERLQSDVRDNHADFSAFRLSVAYLAHLYWRCAAVHSRTGAELAAALREVAQRDAALAAELAADWRAGRPGDPATGPVAATSYVFRPEDCLHGRFLRAARYSATGGEAHD
jgi:hypothetical protein